MSKLKQATKTNQQLKFFGRKMFHSNYSKVKPRVRVVAKVKSKDVQLNLSIGRLQQQEIQLRSQSSLALLCNIGADRASYANRRLQGAANAANAAYTAYSATGQASNAASISSRVF